MIDRYYIMRFTDFLLNENDFNLSRNIKRAKSIIQRYTSPSNPFEDVVLRVAGFTDGMTVPNPNADERINVIDLLDELASAKLLVKRPNGAYKRTEAISRLLSHFINKKIDTALDGDLTKAGRLDLTQTKNMRHLSGDEPAGDKLKNAPPTYKQGGKYSGVTKEYVLKIIKSNDPAWRNLPENTKKMLDDLRTLSNPSYAFKILRSLMNMRATKKGYVPFIEFVQDNFNNEQYVDSLFDLQSIGVLNTKDNTINMGAVNTIREAINFFNADIVENITPMDKLAAFLPNFVKSAVSSSGATHRTINRILTSKQFEPVVVFIRTKLTDATLDDILSRSDEELKPRKTLFTIKYLAKKLDVDTVENLKDKIDEKIENRLNYKSDENKEAKSIGRIGEFFTLFNI